ncbi:MAG TPA: BON domain-containing protein [Longimicrobiales bacterium]|nr:BON domain-containing protein [Longimicrobiales bacterium]
MSSERSTRLILSVAGAAAGMATGIWLWRRGVSARERARWRWSQPRGSAQVVARSLREDGALSGRGITVDAIAEGVVELTGAVRDESEAHRAVEIAQDTTGVYTVVNRLRVDEEEARRVETSRRWTDGAPELRERHHYGMGVGMGTRRQARSTDPDRPSDKQKILERELEVNSMDEDAAPESDLNARRRVESTRVKPGDERAMEEAGLRSRPEPSAAMEEAEREADRGERPAGESESGDEERPGG